MKKLTLILIAALLLTAITAEATGYPAIFAGRWDGIRVFRPGYEDPIATIPVTDQYPGLTYDGEYWWAIQDDTIFGFDYNGDLVSSFASPAPEPLGLAYDGEYLWISCSTLKTDDIRVYNVNVDGTPGPYGDFETVGYTGLTCLQGQLYVMNTGGGIEVYDPDGTYIRHLAIYPGTWDYYGIGLADDEDYIWASLDIEERGVSRVYAYDPETGERIPGLGGWGAGYNLGCGIWSESGIEAESIGKIKAFFAEQ